MYSTSASTSLVPFLTPTTNDDTGEPRSASRARGVGVVLGFMQGDAWAGDGARADVLGAVGGNGGTRCHRRKCRVLGGQGAVAHVECKRR